MQQKKILKILHTSSFALKTNIAILKNKVDKLDIDKLAPVPVDLSKLSDVVNNDVIKKGEYKKLVNKVNNIDTSRFILKTKYDADKLELEMKIPGTNNLIKKSDYNTKISEIENKIPSISNLATKAALTTVENKIPGTSNLVKKFSQANLIAKTDFDAKLSGLNRKITKNKSDHLLVKNELNKLKTFDFGYFIEKSDFEEDGVQNYLVFQPVYRYFKFIANTNFISE